MLKSNPFKNSYFELGQAFYQSIKPTPVRNPELIIFNQSLSDELGLDDTVLGSPAETAIYAGNLMPEGAQPLAMAYSGHQFGQFNPNLGDGRAILLGQVHNPDEYSFDIHLKGTGQTAFSRNGDGRAALGPVLREYLVSEAMARLGVPTTRALAAVTTGEEVFRERLLPGGIITRVAASFVRIGTFEHFLARRDRDSLARLADYVIESHYPLLKEAENPYLALLDAVIEGQAALIAQWVQIGFIHGVMNTDNMSVVCETIDYGPCAFMDHYAHDRVFSSIDHHGRYAFKNQPNIGLWNLTRFAECLLPLFDEDEDTAVDMVRERLEGFIRCYQSHWITGMRCKLGLGSSHDEDEALIEELFAIMASGNVDFTLTFYHLSLLDLNSANDTDVLALFDHDESFVQWLNRWRHRLRQEASDDDERKTRMRRVNPVYIPRNHLVEAAIRAAEDHGDFSVFHVLHEVLQKPYEFQPGKEAYMQPPQPHEVVHKTFCGT
ncbi:MAG: YdiU family protein [Gammaproteobacteria bacterium]|nr:MAG: YdiU family protein [Gammaproteobacteria bacterium]